MTKQEDPVGKPCRLIDKSMLNLAEGLVALLADTSELCTPGHRRGRGYHLFIAGLTSPLDTKSISKLEPEDNSFR